MKTVSDFIKTLTEDGEGAVNTISSGAIATKEVPLGKMAKRKDVKESEAYEGENPLADNVGKFPLMGVQAPNPAGTDIEQGATPEDAEAHKKHMFHLKQQHQNDMTSSL